MKETLQTPISRRNVLKAGLGLAGTALLSACGSGTPEPFSRHTSTPISPTSTPTQEPIPTSTQVPTPTPVETITPAVWNTLSTTDQVRAFEAETDPFAEEDEMLESWKLAAEIYTSSLDINISAEELFQNVTVKSIEEAFEIYISHPERKQAVGNNGPESIHNVQAFVDFDTNRVIIIEGNYDKHRNKGQSEETLRQMGIKDGSAMIDLATAFHEYTHIFEAREQLPIAQIDLRREGFSDPIVLNTIESGFQLRGHIEETTPRLFILGGEGFTDAVNRMLLAELDYTIKSNSYVYSAESILLINEKAGVSNEEYVEYLFGKKDRREFIDRWGALKRKNEYSNQEAGAFAVAYHNLHAYGLIPTPIFNRKVGELLNLS